MPASLCSCSYTLALRGRRRSASFCGSTKHSVPQQHESCRLSYVQSTPFIFPLEIEVIMSTLDQCSLGEIALLEAISCRSTSAVDSCRLTRTAYMACATAFDAYKQRLLMMTTTSLAFFHGYHRCPWQLMLHREPAKPTNLRLNPQPLTSCNE